MDRTIFFSIDLFFLMYFFLLNGFYLFLLFLTNPELFRRLKEIRATDSYQLLSFDIMPPVTIIIPAYNEEAIILSSTEAALAAQFPHLQVIVVNDNSTDQTLQKLTDTYQLVPVPPAIPTTLPTAPVKQYFRSKLRPQLLVIHKENGGREDAINAGINACTTPFFIGIDADSFIEADAIHRLMQHLLTQPHTCAMGGTLCVANGCKIENGQIKEIHLPTSFLGKMQVIEYLKIFFFGRLGWNLLGGSFLISGGFGLYKKESVVEVGGLKPVLAGDLDLTMILHKRMRDNRKPYLIDYVYDAIVWTDVPQTYSALAKQRKRWHSSIIDVCWRYRHMVFNPKYGAVGFLHIPYLLFGEGLSPVIEGLGYLYILCCLFYGVLHIQFLWYFFSLAWGVTIFLSLTALIMQQIFLKKYMTTKQVIGMAFLALLENFFYRPFTLWWRIAGFCRYFTKNRFFREPMNRSSITK